MSSCRVLRVVLSAITLMALASPHPLARGCPDKKIGVNVLLNRAIDAAALTDLGQHGTVLDQFPQINALTMNASESEVAAIRALGCVKDAAADGEMAVARMPDVSMSDFSDGANQWSLDAINVTDHGGGRTVAYDGDGVYIAVMDTGLVTNWRAYFPEERVATQFARTFSGGGGAAHVVCDQPEKWEHDTNGHGTSLLGVILGFAYAGTNQPLPATFNGVAPKATIIPVSVGGDTGTDPSHRFESLAAHAILYITDLKTSGALGASPLVINLSNGETYPLILERAAIDYAIANGVIVVAAAGNQADAGMVYPGAYPEVISAGASGWMGNLPPSDPTLTAWILNDVSEGDPSAHYIAPFSSRELPGQQLDLVAPGCFVPVPLTFNEQVDYNFGLGTSYAAPHVTGVAALMLQKNPSLTQSQVESILKSTTLPIGPASVLAPFAGVGHGAAPSFENNRHDVFLFNLPLSWGADATGAGLLQADAALAATPDL